jgi:hypothetical protein
LKTFSRTSWPISIKLGTNNCFGEANSNLFKEDYHQNGKSQWCHLKIFFSRSTAPEKFIFTWKVPVVVQNQVSRKT